MGCSRVSVGFSAEFRKNNEPRRTSLSGAICSRVVATLQQGLAGFRSILVWQLDPPSTQNRLTFEPKKNPAEKSLYTHTKTGAQTQGKNRGVSKCKNGGIRK